MANEIVTEIKHTPGPWQVIAADQPGIDSGDFSVVVYGNDQEEAGIQGNTPEEAQANALLIAAAPDLLSACRQLMGLAQREGWVHVAIQDAQAAIDKAEGRS